MRTPQYQKCPHCEAQSLQYERVENTVGTGSPPQFPLRLAWFHQWLCVKCGYMSQRRIEEVK